MIREIRGMIKWDTWFADTAQVASESLTQLTSNHPSSLCKSGTRKWSKGLLAINNLSFEIEEEEGISTYISPENDQIWSEADTIVEELDGSAQAVCYVKQGGRKFTGNFKSAKSKAHKGRKKQERRSAKFVDTVVEDVQREIAESNQINGVFHQNQNGRYQSQKNEKGINPNVTLGGKPQPGCFACKSRDHSLKDCPKVTEDQKKKIWDRFNEEIKRKRAKGERAISLAEASVVLGFQPADYEIDEDSEEDLLDVDAVDVGQFA